MLTDGQLRELLADFAADTDSLQPDPSFRAALLTKLEAARRPSGSKALLHRWLGGIGAIGQWHPVAWVWLVAVVLAFLLGAIVAGGWRPAPVERLAVVVDQSARPSLLPPRTIGLASTVTLPGAPRSIALDAAGDPWVIAGNRVVQVNRADGQIGHAFDQANGAPTSVASSDGFLWVASQAAGTVAKLDPATGTAILTLQIDSPTGLATDASVTSSPGLVVLSRERSMLSEIDSTSLALRWHATVPADPLLVAAGGGRVWVIGIPSNDRAGWVLLEYAGTDGALVGSLRFHSEWAPPRSLLVSVREPNPAMVWIPDLANGRLLEVDPGTLGVVATIDVGALPTAIAEGADGRIVVTFATGPGTPQDVNGVALVGPVDHAVARYVFRTDPAGAGQGAVGIAVGSSVWISMDWAGAPSLGRIDQAELP